MKTAPLLATSPARPSLPSFLPRFSFSNAGGWGGTRRWHGGTRRWHRGSPGDPSPGPGSPEPGVCSDVTKMPPQKAIPCVPQPGDGFCCHLAVWGQGTMGQGCRTEGPGDPAGPAGHSSSPSGPAPCSSFSAATLGAGEGSCKNPSKPACFCHCSAGEQQG